jgi:hypothetical protein
MSLFNIKNNKIYDRKNNKKKYKNKFIKPWAPKNINVLKKQEWIY